MREQQIGEYIAKKRRDIGLTQDEVGEKLGFTGKAVSKWERGLCFPDVDTLHALAGILHCRVESLINGTELSAISSDKKVEKNQTVIPNSTDSGEYTISLSEGGERVSPLLFGANLEHTRSAISGGLSAQMLRNRKFVGMPQRNGAPLEWFIIGEKCYSMVGNSVVEGKSDHTVESVGSYTRHYQKGHRMPRRYECNSWQIESVGDLCGFGQDRLFIKENREYELRIVLRTSSPIHLTASLTSRGGKECFATAKLLANSDDWKSYRLTLTPNTCDPDAELRITFSDNARIVIGALSLMPCDNFCGMRKEVVACLKEMNIKYLRWPGGNFAGEYNWFDGLLEVDMRAPSESHIAYLTQPHTLGYDFGEMNTDDFISLCREIGAEPSLTLNLTWNTPEENAAWVEYCNGDASTEYGKMRIERGFAEPYNVKYWSLGNEAGYGHMEGDNTPEGYYPIAKASAAAMLEKDKDLILCSSGFQPDERWTSRANNKLVNHAKWTALHNYVDYPAYKDPKNKKQEYEKALGGVEENRHKLQLLSELLEETISVAFDEWNCWYNWYRPRDVFTGIFAAKMLNMFISEQNNSRLVAGAMYQPVSEGCVEVTPDGATLTPMGKAFNLLASHSGGVLKYISDNAAVTENNGRLTLTLINDSFDEVKTFALGFDAEFVSGEMLVGEGIGHFTDFVQSEIKEFKGEITLPPLSIALLIFEN